MTHALLDCFTTWGTQLFWPHPERIAWKTIFVVDPLYTLPYIVILIRLLFLKKDTHKRRKLNWIAITVTTSYLLFTIANKLFINQKFSKMLSQEKIAYLHFDSRPMPLQNILWTANAETGDAFHILFYSWFDSDYQSSYAIQKNHHLLEPYLNNEQIKKLIEISEGYYTITDKEDYLIFNDLRFGQTLGWIDPKSNFVFSYKIKTEQEELVVEEVEKEISQAKALIPLLTNRILGNF